jgi:hypothetical protein
MGKMFRKTITNGKSLIVHLKKEEMIKCYQKENKSFKVTLGHLD